MKYYFIFLIAVFFLISSCRKEGELAPIDQLPAATHTGRNTFGCLIDGKAFAVNGKSFIGHESGVVFQAVNNYAWYCRGSKGAHQIILKFDYNKHPGVPGTFEMSDNYPAGASYFDPNDGNQYQTDSVYKGYLTLQHFDGRVAAGTFRFDCTDGLGKVVHVTDGRFDIEL